MTLSHGATFGISIHQISEVTDGSGEILVVNIRKKNVFFPQQSIFVTPHHARKQCFLYLHSKNDQRTSNRRGGDSCFQQKNA